MKAIKKEGEYRLYKINNAFELWLGTYNKGAFIGYVSNVENWDEALFNAKEEVAALMSVGA
jgi:hypothetical protein